MRCARSAAAGPCSHDAGGFLTLVICTLRVAPRGDEWESYHDNSVASMLEVALREDFYYGL